MWVEMFRENGMAECISPSVREDEDVFKIIKTVKSRQQMHIDKYHKQCHKYYKSRVRNRPGLHCKARRSHVKEFKGVISNEDVFWLAEESEKRKRQKGPGWSKGNVEYFSRQSLDWFPVMDLRVRKNRNRTDVDFVMSWGIAVRDNTEEVLRERFHIPYSQQPSWGADFINTGRVGGTCEADWDHEPRLRPVEKLDQERSILFVPATIRELTPPIVPVVTSEAPPAKTLPPPPTADEEDKVLRFTLGPPPSREVEKAPSKKEVDKSTTDKEAEKWTRIGGCGTEFRPTDKCAFDFIDYDAAIADLKQAFRRRWLRGEN